MSFETLDRSALPSLFLPAGLPATAFLHFSFLLILQKSAEDAQWEFYVNSSSIRCLTAFAQPNFSEVLAACTKHLLASLTLTVDILQSFPTASIPWWYVAMIMNVLAGRFSLSDSFLKWRYFCSTFVSIFSHKVAF